MKVVTTPELVAVLYLKTVFEICLHHILSTDVLYTVWTVHVCCIGLYVRDNMSR